MKNIREPEQLIAIIDEEINGIMGKSAIFKVDQELEKFQGKIKIVKALDQKTKRFMSLRIMLSEVNKFDVCYCCSTKANNCECYTLYKYNRGKLCIIHDELIIKQMYGINKID